MINTRDHVMIAHGVVTYATELATFSRVKGHLLGTMGQAQDN